MNSLQELTNLGYTLTFSSPCRVEYWGKWFVGVKKEGGPQIHGYGDTEELAFEEAFKTALVLEKK